MEAWKKIIEQVVVWQHTKRLQGTTQQEDENIFIASLDAEFLLVKRSAVKEVRFEDEYVVYLVNEEESNEEHNYDAYRFR